jgi:hypothetical protein
MFCARCGQEIPDKTQICPACGGAASVEAYLTPVAQPTAGAIPAPLPPPAVPAGSVHGVGGWLLFFCIGFTILWPLWTLSQYALSHFVFRGLPGAAALIRLLLGITTGVVLWMGKPAAITLLRIYFALTAILLLWIFVNWGRFFMRYNGFSSGVLQRLVMGLGLSIVLFVAGLLYFSRSERVRATYGSNLF